jgi:hypothetical protein
MKSLLYFLTMFTLSNANAQAIKQGDDLKIEFNKLNERYFFKAPNLTSWTEGTGMLFIGTKPNSADCDFLFIALKDTTLIGVIIMSKPNYFLFDREGNSILS